jgi:hypothetical protein
MRLYALPCVLLGKEKSVVFLFVFLLVRTVQLCRCFHFALPYYSTSTSTSTCIADILYNAYKNVHRTRRIIIIIVGGGKTFDRDSHIYIYIYNKEQETQNAIDVLRVVMPYLFFNTVNIR